MNDLYVLCTIVNVRVCNNARYKHLLSKCSSWHRSLCIISTSRQRSLTGRIQVHAVCQRVSFFDLSWQTGSQQLQIVVNKNDKKTGCPCNFPVYDNVQLLTEIAGNKSRILERFAKLPVRRPCMQLLCWCELCSVVQLCINSSLQQQEDGIEIYYFHWETNIKPLSTLVQQSRLWHFRFLLVLEISKASSRTEHKLGNS